MSKAERVGNNSNDVIRQNAWAKWRSSGAVGNINGAVPQQLQINVTNALELIRQGKLSPGRELLSREITKDPNKALKLIAKLLAPQENPFVIDFFLKSLNEQFDLLTDTTKKQIVPKLVSIIEDPKALLLYKSKAVEFLTRVNSYYAVNCLVENIDTPCDSGSTVWSVAENTIHRMVTGKYRIVTMTSHMSKLYQNVMRARSRHVAVREQEREWEKNEGPINPYFYTSRTDVNYNRYNEPASGVEMIGVNGFGERAVYNVPDRFMILNTPMYPKHEGCSDGRGPYIRYETAFSLRDTLKVQDKIDLALLEAHEQGNLSEDGFHYFRGELARLIDQTHADS